MSDAAYENAVKRQAELKQELLEIEGFLRLWHRFSGEKQERNGAASGASDLDLGITAADIQAAANRLDVRSRRAKRAAKAPRGLPRHEVGEFARKFMLEAKHPLTRGDLVQEFKARGIRVGGKDPERNMGTLMWRLRPVFVQLEGFGYWPRDMDYEPANYAASGFVESDDQKAERKAQP
jgi:hypothetical protein